MRLIHIFVLNSDYTSRSRDPKKSKKSGTPQFRRLDYYNPMNFRMHVFNNVTWAGSATVPPVHGSALNYMYTMQLPVDQPSAWDVLA